MHQQASIPSVFLSKESGCLHRVLMLLKRNSALSNAVLENRQISDTVSTEVDLSGNQPLKMHTTCSKVRSILFPGCVQVKLDCGENRLLCD